MRLPTKLTWSVSGRIISSGNAHKCFRNGFPFSQAITGDFEEADVVRFLLCLTGFFLASLFF